MDAPVAREMRRLPTNSTIMIDRPLANTNAFGMIRDHAYSDSPAVRSLFACFGIG